MSHEPSHLNRLGNLQSAEGEHRVRHLHVKPPAAHQDLVATNLGAELGFSCDAVCPSPQHPYCSALSLLHHCAQNDFMRAFPSIEAFFEGGKLQRAAA